MRRLPAFAFAWALSALLLPLPHIAAEAEPAADTGDSPTSGAMASEPAAQPETAEEPAETQVSPADPEPTEDPVVRGRAIAEANCGRCHAIEETGDSPEPAAPPFRELQERYPVEALGESLAEGIVTGHPDMPAFELTAPQVHALISYLKTL